MDKRMAYDATSADDSPTPGYMLAELAKMTLHNYTACKELQDFLVSRITKSNHNIKYKCLVIIRHICRKGRGEFKREIGRHIDVIKACLQFTGPPDPLRGDSIYVRVREAARETIDAIFDSQMPENTSAVKASNRIQGFGGGEAPAPKNNTNGASSGYIGAVASALNSVANSAVNYMGEGAVPVFPGGDPYATPTAGLSSQEVGGYGSPSGIGNPAYADPRSEKRVSLAQKAANMFGANVTVLANTFSSTKGPNVERAPRPGTTNPGVVMAGDVRSGSSGSQYLASNRDIPPALMGGVNTTTPTNVWGQHASGGSFTGNAGTLGDPGAGATSGGPRMLPELPVGAVGSGRVGAGKTDGVYEATVVAKLCEAGGMRVEVPADTIREFLKKAPTLSPDVIGNCIVDQLNRDEWQSRVKALMVVASLVRAPGCEAHKGFWQANLETVTGMGGDGKASVRTQAKKTETAVQETGNVIPYNGEAQTSAAASGGSNHVESLLDVDDDMAAAAPAAPAAAAPSSLFAGMATKRTSVTAAPSTDASPSDLLGDLGAPAPTPAAPAAPVALSSDFLEALGDAMPDGAPPPVPTSQPDVDEPSALPVASGFGFLSGTSIPAAASAAPPASSALDGLDLLGGAMNDLSMGAAPSVVVASPNDTSGFSFMGAVTPAATAAAPAPPMSMGMGPMGGMGTVGGMGMGAMGGAGMHTTIPKSIPPEQQSAAVGKPVDAFSFVSDAMKSGAFNKGS